MIKDIFNEEHKLSKLEISIFIAFAFAFVFYFGETTFFSPLKYLYTSIHESMHVVATFLTGGEVVDYAINKDFSGYITNRGGWTIIISPAGYIGTAALSGLLISNSLNRRISAISLGAISITIILISIIYTTTIFSLGFLINLGVLLTLLGLVLYTKLDSHIAIFLGTFFSFQSLDDVKTYLFNAIQENGEYLQTDAYLLSNRLFGTDMFTLPISLSFAIISLGIWFFAIKRVFIKQRDEEVKYEQYK